MEQILNILNYEGFLKILQALLLSPIIALTVGYIVMKIFKVLFKRSPLYSTTKGFRLTQIATAALQSFTHGTNDAQKAMGIITMALIAKIGRDNICVHIDEALKRAEEN